MGDESVTGASDADRPGYRYYMFPGYDDELARPLMFFGSGTFDGSSYIRARLPEICSGWPL